MVDHPDQGFATSLSNKSIFEYIFPKTKVAESKSEGVGAFGVESDCFVRLWMSNWIIFYITLLNWKFLLKWYNLFWNFCWNIDFLLCTTISIGISSCYKIVDGQTSLRMNSLPGGLATKSNGAGACVETNRLAQGGKQRLNACCLLYAKDNGVGTIVRKQCFQ